MPAFAVFWPLETKLNVPTIADDPDSVAAATADTEEFAATRDEPDATKTPDAVTDAADDDTDAPSRIRVLSVLIVSSGVMLITADAVLTATVSVPDAPRDVAPLSLLRSYSTEVEELAAINTAPSTTVSDAAEAADRPDINASASFTRAIEADIEDADATVADEIRLRIASADAPDVPDTTEPAKEVLNPSAWAWLVAVI